MSNLKELDENVLNNLSLCHSKYLSPSDEGIILIDTGSILSKNIEIVFDSGCFKSVTFILLYKLKIQTKNFFLLSFKLWISKCHNYTLN